MATMPSLEVDDSNISETGSSGDPPRTESAWTEAGYGIDAVQVDPKAYWTYRLSREDDNANFEWNEKWLRAVLKAAQTLATANGHSILDIVDGPPTDTAGTVSQDLWDYYQIYGDNLRSIDAFRPGPFTAHDTAQLKALEAPDGEPLYLIPTGTVVGCKAILDNLYQIASIVCPAMGRFLQTQEERALDGSLEKLQDHVDAVEVFLKSLLNEVRGEDGNEYDDI